MHVDGFRFDLAPALGRPEGAFTQGSAFLAAVQQDPVLSRVKLIAEPWDLSRGGYQLGNFPAGWSEWNDRYRDTVRRFWQGNDGMIPEFASRLTGSSDIFDRTGRRPRSSVNFVTAHDGFTLNDLVSYDHKHNEANLEDNRDGTTPITVGIAASKDRPTNPAIRHLRAQQKRNLLATLLLSQGLPMLLAGDEIYNTQLGNNNAYCQDNEIGWLSWTDVAGRSGADRLRARAHRAATPAPALSAPELLQRNGRARRAASKISAGSIASGREMVDSRLARYHPALARGALRR